MRKTKNITKMLEKNKYQVRPRVNPYQNYQTSYQQTPTQQNYQQLQNPSNSNSRNQKAPPTKKTSPKISI